MARFEMTPAVEWLEDPDNRLSTAQPRYNGLGFFSVKDDSRSGAWAWNEPATTLYGDLDYYQLPQAFYDALNDRGTDDYPQFEEVAA